LKPGDGGDDPPPRGTVNAPHEPAEEVQAPWEIDLSRLADRILLAKYAPAGVIVNEDLDVLHVRGRTGPYLEMPSGAASFNLLKMLREGLLVDVRAAVKRARTTGAPVRRDGAQVRRNGGLVRVNIVVVPVRASTAPGAFLVLFEDSPPPAASASKRRGADRTKLRGQERRTTQVLRAELKSTKEYLQAIINEREAANEELKSASEELQSTNEELQSTNEVPPEQGGRVPALALTAYVRPEDRERVVAAGFNQHLAKPIDPVDLAGAVAQLTARASATTRHP